MKDIINTGILAFSFLALFGIAEILYHKVNVKAEWTRKLVHFGTGILTLLFPVMLNDHLYVFFLCASFALLLLASLRFNRLKSIHAIDRKSYGSISYPVFERRVFRRREEKKRDFAVSFPKAAFCDF